MRISADQPRAQLNQSAPQDALRAINPPDDRTFNFTRELDASLLGYITSFLPPSSAIHFSRSTPYVASLAMRDSVEAERVDVIKLFREPQAIAMVKKSLGYEGGATPPWIRHESLLIEHRLSNGFHFSGIELLDPRLSANNPVAAQQAQTVLATFSPAGALLSIDNTQHFRPDDTQRVRIWQHSAVSGWSPHTLTENFYADFESVAMTRDGNTLIAASGFEASLFVFKRNAAKVFHLAGQLDYTFFYHALTHPHHLMFSPDERFITTSRLSSPRLVRMFALDEQVTGLETLLTPDARFHNVSFHPGDRAFLVVPFIDNERWRSASQYIHVWSQDEHSRWHESVLEGSNHPIIDATFSPDGTCIASQTNAGLSVWEKNTQGTWIQASSNDVSLHVDPWGRYDQIRFSPDSQSILTNGDSPRSIFVWKKDTAGMWNPERLTGFENEPDYLDFSPDGNQIIASIKMNENDAAQSSSVVKLWKKNSSSEWVLNGDIHLTGALVQAPSVSRDGHYLLAGCYQPVTQHGITMLSNPTFSLYQTLGEHGQWHCTRLEGEGWRAQQAQFSPSGIDIAIIDNHQNLRVVGRRI